MIDYLGFELRISEAFGGLSRVEVANRLGINYQTLSNWLNGRNEFPVSELARVADITNCSIHWILTGVEPKTLSSPQVSIDLMLRDLIREMISEEFQVRESAEHGGEVFDLGRAVQKHTDPRGVLIDWYKFDKLTPPTDIEELSTLGWDEMSSAERIKRVRAARNVLARQSEIKNNKPRL